MMRDDSQGGADDAGGRRPKKLSNERATVIDGRFSAVRKRKKNDAAKCLDFATRVSVASDCAGN